MQYGNHFIGAPRGNRSGNSLNRARHTELANDLCAEERNKCCGMAPSGEKVDALLVDIENSRYVI